MAGIELDGQAGRLYRFFQWPVRLVAMNLLWILGMLAGLLIAGLAPATQALYVVIREQLRGRPVRIWAEFWRSWRQALTSAQVVLGPPLLTVVVVVFYLFAPRGTPFVFATTLIALAYLAALIQLPAVRARHDLSATELWKSAAAIAWRQPLLSLGVVLLSAVVVVVAWFVAPLALPLFVPALPALLGSLVVDRGLRRLTTAAAP